MARKSSLPSVARALPAIAFLLAATAAVAADTARPGPPPGGKGGFRIPAESFAACAGKTVDAACSFTDARSKKTLSGTCVAPPNSSSTDSLSCRPARPEGAAKEK